MKSNRLILILAIFVLTVTSACSEAPAADVDPDLSPNFMLGTDMMHPVLFLFDIESDRMITVDLTKDPLWPGGMPLHAITTLDGRKAYLSLMGSAEEPTNILALRVNTIDWRDGTADVRITRVLRAEEAGSRPIMRVPTQTDPRQPVTSLWMPQNQQLHGPSIHPSGKFIYFAQWTDDKIRVIDVERDELAVVDPIRHGELTQQIHGVFFNPSGTLAIGNPYYFDRDHVVLFNADARTGDLQPQKAIPLAADEATNARAAWTHFVDWLDDRYAVTASQQLGPTSLTPPGQTVVGPSVWLIDAEEGTARMIVGPTDRVDGAGVYKPASDLMVVNGKLFVAEEDTGDEEINESYISIFDFSDRTQPRFLKRLRPGKELPDGWDVSHEFYRTTDRRWLYAQSWGSGHLVKIDPATDEVVKVWSKEDGFHMPHGNFIPGNLR